MGVDLNAQAGDVTALGLLATKAKQRAWNSRGCMSAPPTDPNLEGGARFDSGRGHKAD